MGARLNRAPLVVHAVLLGARQIPGRRARAAAIRNVALPLTRRFTTPLVVPVAGGSHMLVRTEDYVGRMLALTGVWEPQVTAAFRALLARGDVCVDVGANIGYFTLLASRLVGPGGRVYALEPSPASYDRLWANLELNHADNVNALPVAASNTAEPTAVLYEGPPSNPGGASLQESRVGDAVSHVETARLDSLVDDADIARLRLVKIDVEGAELDVLAGMTGLFERGALPAVVLEVSPEWSGEDMPRAVLDFAAHHDLVAYELPRVPPFEWHERTAFAPRAVGRVDDQQDWLLVPATT